MSKEYTVEYGSTGIYTKKIYNSKDEALQFAYDLNDRYRNSGCNDSIRVYIAGFFSNDVIWENK